MDKSKIKISIGLGNKLINQSIKTSYIPSKFSMAPHFRPYSVKATSPVKNPTDERTPNIIEKTTHTHTDNKGILYNIFHRCIAIVNEPSFGIIDGEVGIGGNSVNNKKISKNMGRKHK